MDFVNGIIVVNVTRGLLLVLDGWNLAILIICLASQKIAIAKKSLHFRIAKYYTAAFKIAKKSPENR